MFKVSNAIVLVAETQRSEKDMTVLRSICEGIKKKVSEEEKIELGLVVLVKSGSVPKTTSGKIQRWAAKNKLVGGKMSVVMEVRFGHFSNFLSERVHGNNGKDEGRGRRGQEERKVATEVRRIFSITLKYSKSDPVDPFSPMTSKSMGANLFIFIFIKKTIGDFNSTFFLVVIVRIYKPMKSV